MRFAEPPRSALGAGVFFDEVPTVSVHEEEWEELPAWLSRIAQKGVEKFGQHKLAPHPSSDDADCDYADSLSRSDRPNRSGSMFSSLHTLPSSDGTRTFFKSVRCVDERALFFDDVLVAHQFQIDQPCRYGSGSIAQHALVGLGCSSCSLLGFALYGSVDEAMRDAVDSGFCCAVVPIHGGRVHACRACGQRRCAEVRHPDLACLSLLRCNAEVTEGMRALSC